MKPFVSLVVVLLCATTFAQSENDGLDPRTKKELAAKTAELEVAQKSLMDANMALQDVYARLETAFRSARDGKAGAVRDDLVRALEEPFADARKASGRRARRAFSRGLAKALAKLEDELLVALRSRVQDASVAALETASKEAGFAEQSSEDFAQSVITTMFPEDSEFWKVWNEVVAPGLVEATTYADARSAVKTIEDQIMVLRDPKMAYTIGAPEGMARVPSGSYAIESSEGFTKKKRRTRIKDVYVDLYEVSHGDYWSKFYVNITDKAQKDALLPRYKDKKGRTRAWWLQDPESGEHAPDPEMMLKPVTGIDVAAAIAYAKSRGKRLPTEAELVAASSGELDKSTRYPYGDVYREGLANDRKAGVGETVDVTSMKLGRSVFGIYHTVGNVKEMTSTTADGKEFVDQVPAGQNIVIRGGSYDSNQNGASRYWRGEMPGASARLIDVGFRCALTVPPSK